MFTKIVEALVFTACLLVVPAVAVSWPAEVTEVNQTAALKLALRSVDECSVFFIYDSADEMSLRSVPQFAAAATSLDGFGRFYAIDMRDAHLAWVLDAWKVNVVPTIRGFSWEQQVRKTWIKTPLDGVGTIRSMAEWSPEQNINQNTLKTFTLNLQGSKVPITRVDQDSKVQALLDHVSRLNNPSVVLIGNKPTSSQLYKAVAISFVGRADFFEVNQAKAPSASQVFGVKEALPVLMVFDKSGSKFVYKGDLNPKALSAFISEHTEARDAFIARKAAQDNLKLSREGVRQISPLLPIETAEHWQVDVLDRQGITGVFFLDGADTQVVAERRATIAQFLEAAGPRSSVSKFVWVNRAQSPKLYSLLTTVQDAEPAELVFVSTKRKVFQRYLGSPTTQGIADFVKGPMSRGVGSVSFESLPPFGA